MCHTSGLHNAQIEKFVEQGMPQKIVKSVQYTIKKRVLKDRKERDRDNTLSASEDEHSAETIVGVVHALQSLETAEFAAGATQKQDTMASLLPRAELKIPKLCGRFRRMKSAPAMNGHTKSEASTVAVAYSSDMLAAATQLTKQFAYRLQCSVGKMQNSKIYTLLTKTTQPAHIIAICILSFVLLAVGPVLIDGPATDAKRGKHTLVVIAYLGAFATHFGAQIWMTFVSGLSLYFSLPRHTFGQCQQILFPKYFALNAILSVGMLVLFVKYFLGATWTTGTCIQLGALALTAFIEVSVRLYLAPPMLRLMHEKYKIEGAIGSGQEVGSIVQGDLIQCPHYQRIHKAFRRIHMTIAMGNMAVLVATCVHLYFLASKIQLS